MDLEGNIYDLRGNFIGTTDENNGEEELVEGSSQIINEGEGNSQLFMGEEEEEEEQEY